MALEPVGGKYEGVWTNKLKLKKALYKKLRTSHIRL